MPRIIYLDGILIDHVAEFVFGARTTLQSMYTVDAPGYVDATTKLLQILATPARLAFGRGRMKTEAAEELREHLTAAKKTKRVHPLSRQQRAALRPQALAWLETNWPRIVTTLETDKTLRHDLAAHIQKEFYLYWRKIDAQW